MLAITCFENVYAHPCIYSYGRLRRDNSTKIAVYAMRRRRQIRLSPISEVKNQKMSMANIAENDAIESPFAKLYKYSKSVEPLWRYRDLNMTKIEHVFAICRRPEPDDDVISGPNVKTTECYVVVNFEVASSSRFRDIQTRSPPYGGDMRNATPLYSKTLPIFFTREI